MSRVANGTVNRYAPVLSAGELYKSLCKPDRPHCRATALCQVESATATASCQPHFWMGNATQCCAVRQEPGFNEGNAVEVTCTAAGNHFGQKGVIKERPFSSSLALLDTYLVRFEDGSTMVLTRNNLLPLSQDLGPPAPPSPPPCPPHTGANCPEALPERI